MALGISSLLSTIADSKLQLGDCRPIKTPACWGAVHPTSKLVGFLAQFIKFFRPDPPFPTTRFSLFAFGCIKTPPQAVEAQIDGIRYHISSFNSRE